VKYSRKIPNPLSISGDVFDSKPMLLACKNGVIDLKTGKFRPGRQEDYISKASPIEWKGFDYPAPLWEKFKKEIQDNDKEMIDFVERLLGYSITGSIDEHIFPVFQGRGRNGKGAIVKVLRHVLGPLASVVPSEMLLEQRFSKNSSAPAPDIMALKGLRLAFCSEVSEKRSFSASQIKLLTGGDELSARNPHDKYQSTFKPSHKLILLTNDRPRCPDSDYAFWTRMRLIEFPFSFVPDPDPKKSFEKKAVKDLDAQLMEEGPGILASLVHDCLRWQKEGLKPPAKVLASTAEYMRDEDILSGFIEQCCIVGPALNVSAAQLKETWEKWFRENIGDKPYSWRWVGLRLKKKFESYNKDGRTWYRGLGLIELS
jgi:putative DNA primase/helicase